MPIIITGAERLRIAFQYRCRVRLHEMKPMLAPVTIDLFNETVAGVGLTLRRNLYHLQNRFRVLLHVFLDESLMHPQVIYLSWYISKNL